MKVFVDYHVVVYGFVKMNKELEIPCGEPQMVGWNCNEGHLCSTCECNLKIQQAKQDFWNDIVKARGYADTQKELIRVRKVLKKHGVK